MDPTYLFIRCSITTAISLLLGGYVLWLDSKNTLNRLVFLICVWVAVLNILAAGAYSSRDKDGIVYWTHGVSFFAHTFFSLNLHFYIYLKEKKGLNAWKLILVYLPALLLTPFPIINYKNYFDYVQINGEWKWIPSIDSIWLYIVITYMFLYTAISMFIAYRYKKQTQLNREKKQATVLIVSYSLFIITNTITISILPAIYPQAPNIPSVYTLIYIIGLSYAVFKYRFLAVTPALAAEDILSHISDMVIFLDRQLKVIVANFRAGELLSLQPEILIGLRFPEIINSGESIEEILKNFLDGNESFLQLRLFYKKTGGDTILTDSYLSRVKDKFSDIVGILIISKEIKGLKEFQREYRITPRQLEIITMSVSGLSNIKIGQTLSLAERTIETHLSNIYHKLGINNKIELLNIAREYNLI